MHANTALRHFYNFICNSSRFLSSIPSVALQSVANKSLNELLKLYLAAMFRFWVLESIGNKVVLCFQSQVVNVEEKFQLFLKIGKKSLSVYVDSHQNASAGKIFVVRLFCSSHSVRILCVYFCAFFQDFYLSSSWRVNVYWKAERSV